MLFWIIFKKIPACCVSNLGLSVWGLALLPPALTLVIIRKFLTKIYTVIWGNVWVSLKVIKMTTFDQNQFMTCYLIFNLRPTCFSNSETITAISFCRNVHPHAPDQLPPHAPVAQKTADQRWLIAEKIVKIWVHFFI